MSQPHEELARICGAHYAPFGRMFEARHKDDDREDWGGGTQREQGNVRERARGIRCPKCQWQPRRHDRWQCTCGCVWNTFETRANCPDCRYVWPWTQCFRCHEKSPHVDWYEGGRDGSGYQGA